MNKIDRKKYKSDRDKFAVLKAKHCCEIMAQYHFMVNDYFVAGADHDCASSARADSTEISLSTGFDHSTFELNFCPNCGASQMATKKKAVRKYPGIKNKLYTVAHIQDLIARANNLRSYRNQWTGNSTYGQGTAAHFGLVALVEMMEVIITGSTGDGANGFRSARQVGSDVIARLESIEKAFGDGEYDEDEEDDEE